MLPSFQVRVLHVILSIYFVLQIDATQHLQVVVSTKINWKGGGGGGRQGRVLAMNECITDTNDTSINRLSTKHSTWNVRREK